MPKIARIIAVGYPHHITQHGNNRAVLFSDDEDRQIHLKLLSRYSNKYQISIWAYCLMDNHIHLFAVQETETAFSRGIGLTNLIYTQYLNRKLKQSGRIWQNRFFSCVVENDHYLWSVARYIERNRLKVELAATAEFVRDEDEEGDNANHRATRTGRPYGTDQFIDQLEFLLNQQLRPGKPGRPAKTGTCPEF